MITSTKLTHTSFSFVRSDGTQKRKQGTKVFNDKGEEVNLKTGEAMIMEQTIEEEPEPEPDNGPLPIPSCS